MTVNVASDLYVQTMGPPDARISLVFLHGPGLDHTCFRPFVDALADEFLLIFYDARLCGRSARESSLPVDLDVLSDDLARVIECHTGNTTVVAVAHSFAPYVALNAARRAPTLLSGLVLVAPGLSLSIGQTLLSYFNAHGTRQQQDLIQAAFAGQIVDDRELSRAWRTSLPLYVTQCDEAFTERLLGDTMFSANAFNAFVAHAFGRLDWQAAIADSRLPTLVMSGAHDWIEGDPAGGSRALANLNPRATLHVFNKSGHIPFAEEPEGFVDVLRGWLRGLRLTELA